MAAQAQKNPFIPVALTYARHDNLGFLILPYDTLFTCDITRNKQEGFCVICAKSKEQAEALFPYINYDFSCTVKNISTITPFHLGTVHSLIHGNRYSGMTLLTAVTAYKGRSCAPSMLVPALSDCRLHGPQHDFKASSKYFLFKELQQVLFLNLVKNYLDETKQRRPIVTRDQIMTAPVGVEELLWLKNDKWSGSSGFACKEYKITEGTLNDHGPVRIAQIFGYPLQHGSISSKPWVEPRATAG